MSKNKHISMADIRKRKKKLEDELELLEGNIEDRFTGVQKKVLGSLEPIEIIKRNPLKSVGTSVLIGFAIGMLGAGKTTDQKSERQLQKEKILNLFLNEVKRVAARKAASHISDLIDQKLTGDK